MNAPNVSPRSISTAICRLLIFLLLVYLLWLSGQPGNAGAQQAVGQVASVSAASYEKNVAPDSIVAAFGNSLATTTQVAATLPLPNILSNIAVEVNGRSAGLLFISPSQINYLLPEDLNEGTGQVLVRRNGQIVAAGEIEIRAGAPSIFMANVDAQGPPAANLIRVRANNTVVEEAVPQFDGTKGRFVSRLIDLDAPNELVFLILYLTGTSREPQARDYRVLLGGSECRPEFMTYVGIAPGFAGLKQINLDLGGCVRRLRGEDVRANFTGIVTVALADIRNGQTSNLFELEFAPPSGAPPRVTGLNRAITLAGEVLEIQGSGLAETTEVYLTDGNKKRFNAQIEKPVTATSVRVRVPFGAGTGTITAVTGRGESTFPLTMRTSVSGVVQLVQRQPDGRDQRVGVRNAMVSIVSPNVSAPVPTGDDGSFLIPDAMIPPAAQGAPIYLIVDSTKAGIAGLSLKRVDRMIAFAGRDNQFPGYLELRPSTGPTIPVGSNGSLSAEPIRMRASARPEENEYTGQTGEIVFEPNGSTIRFADGAMVNAVTVTALDAGRVPADLPPGEFSSAIVQLTPFGGQLTPGGKLTLPNTDGLPAGTTATLYRYDQTTGSGTLGQWVTAGLATISGDGLRIETGPNAIKETSYYFVSVPRPLTTIYGSVKEADGQPARAAQVQVRGQSGFALTDVNGGFLLLKVPVVGSEMVIEVSYLRADGTVDRAERRGVVPRVGTTAVSPPIVLPGQGQSRAPVLLLPKSLTIEAGKTTDYNFLAYARLTTATLPPPIVTGAPFASITGLGNDRYILRLTPGISAVGNYTLTVTATDSDTRRTEETVALEVKAPVSNTLVAASQSLTTDEDQAVGITLGGSGGTQYRIVNAPQRGILSGVEPNLVYTPNRDYHGADNFSFAIGNGSAESAPAFVTIAVRPVSDAPRLEAGANFKTNIGQLLRAVINGFDPDAGQTLTLTNSALPEGARIERTTGTSWLFEWRPTGQQIGNYKVDLTLRDDGAPMLSDQKSITIIVDATWSPSVILGPRSFINALIALDDVILAGTEGGGVYRSSDNGATWSEANLGLPASNAREVVALAVSEGAVFAGTYAGGVYRTTDSGLTWSEAHRGLPDSIRSLTVSGGAIYAGTNGGGVYRSDDQGGTWFEVNTGLPPGDGRNVIALAANGGTIYAGTNGMGIYRSTNRGATWLESNGGIAEGGARYLQAFLASGGAIYAGTLGGGIYRSNDGGVTWAEVNTGLPTGDGRDVQALTASGGVIYAGTMSGVYRSSDNGATWSETNHNLAAGAARDVISALASGGTIYLGTYGAGIYRSGDNGGSWSEANNGLPAGFAIKGVSLVSSGGATYKGTYGAGIYRSSDNGATWSPVNNGLSNGSSRQVTALTTNGGVLIAGTDGAGIFRSINNGELWIEANSGLPDGEAHSVFSLTASAGAIVAGTQGGGIYRSLDNGISWSAANNGLPSNARRVISLTTSGNIIFAGTIEAGIYRSNDNGATWSAANNGLPANDARTVHSLTVGGGTIYAGTNGEGIYRSTDNGATWSAANTGLPESDARIVRSLTTSGGMVYAGSDGEGIYRSTDNGATWSEVSNGLPEGVARKVYALGASGAAIIAGTFGGGTFTLIESAIVWEPRNNGLSNPTITAAVFDDQALMVGTFGGGVFRTANEGLNWTAANTGLPPNARVQSFARHAGGIFAGLLGNGVYFSADRGVNWAARSNGLTNLRVRTLASDGTALLAGTEGGVFRSTDQGNNWTATSTGLTDLRVLSLAVSGNVLYAGAENGLFRSQNGGNSWAAINTGLGNLYILSLGIAPDGNTVLAGTTGGLYRSTNGGGNWTLVTNGISDRVVALTFAVSGTKQLLGTFSGYYISEDNGASWRPRNAGLFSLQVGALVVKGDQVFAGTRGSGVFISRLE